MLTFNCSLKVYEIRGMEGHSYVFLINVQSGPRYKQHGYAEQSSKIALGNVASKLPFCQSFAIKYFKAIC